MRFAREIFMNTEDECQWLRTTHLKHIDFPAFNSFKLTGNEDAPQAVELYEARKPEYNHHPVVTYTQNEQGDLEGPPRVRPTVKRRTRPGA